MNPDPNEPFHVVKFESHISFAEFQMRLTSNLILDAMKLQSAGGLGLASKSFAEVLAPSIFAAPGEYVDQGEEYDNVLFFDEVAMRLCQRLRYNPPSPSGPLKRRDLPKNLAEVLRLPVW